MAVRWSNGMTGKNDLLKDIPVKLICCVKTGVCDIVTLLNFVLKSDLPIK